MANKVDGRKVTFTMPDGTVRDSLEDYVLPYNEKTAPAFDIADRIARQTMEAREKGA